MPNRASKLSRQKAASLSVVDSWCDAAPLGAARRHAQFNSAPHLGARCSVRASPDAVLTRSQQLIEPKAPLALRLAAVLMRGVVQLYSRQLFFLSGAPRALLSHAAPFCIASACA